jgi:uncharacterized protein (DUF2235 family)
LVVEPEKELYVSHASNDGSSIKRKLIVCCDGTWNMPNQPGAPTNVVKMLRAIRPVDDNGGSQIVHYHPGIGTGNFVDRFMGGTVGVGLVSNVQSAYGFLVDNYFPGDEIYLFGFSRGAYTVRSLAGFVDLVGLVRKMDMELFIEVFEIYRKHRLIRTTNRPEDLAASFRPYLRGGDPAYRSLLAALQRSRRISILFIGVWDTVGALGVPVGPLRWIGRNRYNFHSTQLSESVRFAYHALAIDEHRRAFRPSIWRRPTNRNGSPTSETQTLEQVWFAGAHSNVGGGYRDSGLSDIAFLWMASKAATARRAPTDRPLALDIDYLQTRVQRTMGRLENSRTWRWWLRRPFFRPVLDASRLGAEMESCERIHRSVLLRYQCEESRSFIPYPYRPKNAKQLLDQSDPKIIADFTEFENLYRSWKVAPSEHMPVGH